ncbi:MAG: NUDIX domain-containing protein [Candidatus Micrarchaeia archaeon]
MKAYDFSKSTHYTVSVVVIKERRVLLLKQERSPFWLLPGGHIEDDELPHEAAIREVKEETGLETEILEKPDEKSRTKIAVPLPLPHHMVLLPCRDKRDVNLVFTARVVSGSLKIDSESKEAKWFAKQQLLDDPSVGPNIRYHAINVLEGHPEI